MFAVFDGLAESLEVCAKLLPGLALADGFEHADNRERLLAILLREEAYISGHGVRCRMRLGQVLPVR